MKFNFEDISYSGHHGSPYLQALLKLDTESTRTGGHMKSAHALLDTLMDTHGRSRQNDTGADRYRAVNEAASASGEHQSLLSSFHQLRNKTSRKTGLQKSSDHELLAINQNTADHHART